MWVDKQVWLSERETAIRNLAALTELRAHNASLKTTQDWLIVRLTQIEHERASLIHRYMGITIAVPSIEPAPNSNESGDVLNSLPSFEDVGDAEAARLGYGWDDETGTVTYGRK